MLQQLQINNIALIDRINIELDNGLNVLTGETGAGKSIIIDSINAVLGERLSKDLIRTGCDKATVEAVFQVDNKVFEGVFEELGIEPEEDGTLIISREYSVSGKNSCRINGKMVTVTMLKEIGQRLIDIHGQYDNQSLLRTESHIELLDSFAGSSMVDIKQKYIKFLGDYKEAKAKLRSLTGDKNDRERKIDLLKYQIEEIKKARLKAGEEEELNKQRVLLSSSEKIMGALANAYEFLYSGSNIKSSVTDGISEALSEINGIIKFDETFSNIARKLEELSYQLDDIVEEIRKEKDNAEFNPELLEQIEERIDVIYKLKRKYGNSIEEVLGYCRKIEEELDEIVKSEEIISELKERIIKLEEKLLETAAGLHNERLKSCKILEERICDELNDLEMKKAVFKVNIVYDDGADSNGERKFSSNGLDKVEFLISPNVGEPLKPLSKIASGGEMSRIMLAIKNILANVDNIPTLIFDEIDIGISGIAAQKVGEKLSYISRTHQVLCVTHLAQIACMADSHYLIEKKSENEKTVTSVNKMKDDRVKHEIARILGGASISEITLKHAEEMLKNASQFKVK